MLWQSVVATFHEVPQSSRLSPEDSLNVVALSAFWTSSVVNKLKVLIGIFFCRILFRLVLELHLLSGDLLILTACKSENSVRPGNYKHWKSYNDLIAQRKEMDRKSLSKSASKRVVWKLVRVCQTYDENKIFSFFTETRCRRAHALRKSEYLLRRFFFSHTINSLHYSDIPYE